MRREQAARRSRKISTPLLGNLGAQEANDWLDGFSLFSAKPWFVEISLDVSEDPARRAFDDAIDSRFHLNIYREEWGVYFCHDRRASWIRVTDVAFIHGRDDFRLHDAVTSLARVGALLRKIEHHHRLRFNREQALIRTNLRTAKVPVRSWLVGL